MSDAQTRANAASMCKNLGGHLAAARNGNQYFEMRQLAMSRTATHVWIDGIYNETYNAWMCNKLADPNVDERNTCTVLPWACYPHEQPDNLSPGENCAALTRDLNYLVSDEVCDNQYQYICKFNGNGAPAGGGR